METTTIHAPQRSCEDQQKAVVSLFGGAAFKPPAGFCTGVALSLWPWKIGGRDLGQHEGTQGTSGPSNQLA